MQKEQSQVGRTLMEMLGVLAIIGVLSISALLGYNYAITKYKVNETWSELERRAVAGISKLMIVKEVVSGEFLEEFKNVTVLGYPISQNMLDESHFDIILNEVPEKVCRMLIETNPDDYYIIYVNDTLATQADLCSEQNEMIFEVGQGGAVERCETSDDCTRSCDKCQNGICQSNCSSGMKCARSINSFSYSCCSSDYIIDGYCCSQIQTDENGQKTCCTLIDICCPIGYFKPEGVSNCISCDDPSSYRSIQTAGAACYMCSNRILAGWTCALECPANSHDNGFGECECDDADAIQDKNGNCHSCEEVTGTEDSHYYIWHGHYSYNGDSHTLSTSHCTRCNMRTAGAGESTGGGYCVKCSQGTVAKGGSCETCPDDLSGLVSRFQCESCDGTWNDTEESCSK